VALPVQILAHHEFFLFLAKYNSLKLLKALVCLHPADLNLCNPHSNTTPTHCAQCMHTLRKAHKPPRSHTHTLARTHTRKRVRSRAHTHTHTHTHLQETAHSGRACTLHMAW